MRRQRRQDVLQRRVLVHVAADIQRGELAHFRGAGNRAAEDDDGRLFQIDIAQCAHEVHTMAMRQPQIDDDEIDRGEVGLDARDELASARHRNSLVAGALERRLEAVPHKGRVVRDDHRLGRDLRRFGGGGAHVMSIGSAVGRP